MDITQSTIPHIFRNKYLRGNSTGIMAGGNAYSNTSTGGGGGNTNHAEHATNADIADVAKSLAKVLNIYGNAWSGTTDLEAISATTIDADSIVTDELTATTGNINALTATTGNINALTATTINSTNINNSDTIKTKNLDVTGSAHFFQLIIDKIKAAGGAVMLTPADGFKVDKVETITTGYRLYFRSTDENGKGIMNMWKVNDQAICQSFNQASVGTSYNVSNKYYWSLVTAIDEAPVKVSIDSVEHDCHYIDISTTTKDGNVNPEVGDEIVQLGYRGNDDAKRQSAIYITAYQSVDTGLTAPAFAEYKGINDFNLASHRYSYIDATGAHFRGEFSVSDGTSIEDYIDGEIEEKTVEFKIDIDGLTSRVTKTSNPNILPANGWKDQDGKNVLQEDDEEYTLSASTSSEEVATLSEDDLEAYPPTMYLNAGDYTMSLYSHSKFNNISYGYEKEVLNQVIETKTEVNKKDKWHNYPRSIMTFEAPIDGYYHLGVTQMDASYSGDTPYEGDTDSYREKTYLTLTADKQSAYEVIGTIQLTATVTPEVYNGKITYYSSNSEIATVDANGKVRCLKAGAFKIVAVAERKVVGKRIFLESTAEIELTSLALNTATPTITLNMPNNPLKKGMIYNVTASVSPKEYKGKVNFSTSDNTIASITNDGILSVKDYGFFYVYAETEQYINPDNHTKYFGTGVSKSAYADGTEQSTTLTFTVGGTYFMPNKTYQTQAVVTPSGYIGTIQYSSSDESIATISSTGLISTKKIGDVTFTATAPETKSNGIVYKSSTATLNMTVSMNFEVIAGLPVSNTIQMKTIYGDDDVTKATTWSLSCGSALATIDSNGLISIGTIANNNTITVYASYNGSTKSVNIVISYVKMSTNSSTNKITYTTTDGQIADIGVTEGFGATFVSNVYTSSGGVVTFNSDITKIPDGAFAGALNLESVELPETVDLIYQRAFLCSTLKDIKLTNLKTTFKDGTYYQSGHRTFDNDVNYYVPRQAFATHNYAVGAKRYYDYYENNVLPLMNFNSQSLSNYSQIGNALLVNQESHQNKRTYSSYYQTYYKFTYDRDLTTLNKITGSNAVGVPLTVKTIPSNLAVSDSAFMDFVIPDSVETVSSSVVTGSNSGWLQYVDLGKNVKTIGTNPFVIQSEFDYITSRNTTPPTLGSLTQSCFKIYVPRESMKAYQEASNWNYQGYDYLPIVENWIIDYETNDGLPINVSKTGWEHKLLSNVCTNGKGRLCFYGDITKIPDSAFKNCYNLTRITIPESVTEIGYMPLEGCNNLTAVYCYPTIPPKTVWAFNALSNETFAMLYVAPIAEGAYKNIWSGFYTPYIDLFNFTDYVTHYEEGIVKTPVTITPSQNSDIYYTTFDDKVLGVQTGKTYGATFVSETYENGYGKIHFDGNVTTIPQNAFTSYNDLRLYSISLPTSVKTIEDSAFFQSNIRHIKLNEGITTIGSNVFDVMDNLEELTIPDSVTTIGNVSRCPKLKTLILGSGLTEITSPYSVPNLTRIICKASTPISWNPYGDANAGLPNVDICKVYVPDALVDDYKSLNIWKNYQIIPLSLLCDGLDDIHEDKHNWPATNSFELNESMIGWSKWLNAGLAAHNGEMCSWVVSDTTPTYTLEDVCAGNYYLRVFATTRLYPATPSLTISITAIDEKGNTTSVASITQEGLTKDVWTQITKEFTITGHTKYMVIKFTSSNAYIDDFYLNKFEMPTKINDAIDVRWTGGGEASLYSDTSYYCPSPCVYDSSRANYTSIKLPTTATKITRLKVPSTCSVSCYNCTGLIEVDLTEWVASKPTTFISFYGCSSLTSLDLSGCNLKDMTYSYKPLYKCTSLTTIYMRGCSAESIQFIRDRLSEASLTGVSIVTE